MLKVHPELIKKPLFHGRTMSFPENCVQIVCIKLMICVTFSFISKRFQTELSNSYTVKG